MVRSRLRRALGRDGAPTAFDLVRDLPGGLRVHVRDESDWFVYNEIFVEGEYDAAIDRALETRRHDELVVVDVGANVGFFTAHVIDRVRRVGDIGIDATLVEGSPAVFAELSSRFDESIPGVNVDLVNGLAGRREGAGQIAEVPFSARNTTRPEQNTGIMPVGEMVHHDVPYVDLTQQLADKPEIDLFKCDIEGAEEALIETYADDVLVRVRVAVFELHRRLIDVEAALGRLASAGLHQVATLADSDETSLVLFARS